MSEVNIFYHIPALYGESLDGLNIKPSGVYIDLTFGGGGHSRGILSRLGSDGRLYGFDQDEDAQANIPDDKRFTFVHSNFRYLSNFMRYYGVEQVDGILADLGVSSHHFDDEGRGFSYRFDGSPDMRMNTRGGKTAAEVLNGYSEDALEALFRKYGEVSNASRLATAIVKARSTAPIGSIEDFMKIIRPLAIWENDKKYFSRVFQAIRIEVNDEYEALREMLPQALKLLKSGGRLAIIAYHSLETRLVKKFFRTGNAEGESLTDFYGHRSTPFRLIGSNIKPSAEEIANNPRSRSAHLRIAEKI